jgi:hypothetical protein
MLTDMTKAGDPQFVATTFAGGLQHLLVPYSLVWTAIDAPRPPRARVRASSQPASSTTTKEMSC